MERGSGLCQKESCNYCVLPFLLGKECNQPSRFQDCHLHTAADSTKVCYPNTATQISCCSFGLCNQDLFYLPWTLQPDLDVLMSFLSSLPPSVLIHCIIITNGFLTPPEVNSTSSWWFWRTSMIQQCTLAPNGFLIPISLFNISQDCQISLTSKPSLQFSLYPHFTWNNLFHSMHMPKSNHCLQDRC